MNKQVIRGAIVTKFGSQCVAAKELGINERRLSRLLNGHDQLKPEEAETLMAKLGVSMAEEIS
jgi:plasmid maintenance system antidote protein VapI